MVEVANIFTWSRSRDSAFRECRRKYYYQYYGSWGGWEAAASAEARRLYILKQLASRQQWAGKVVHDAVEMVLKAVAAGHELPREPFIRDVIERMRADWRNSRARRYWKEPKSAALFEHEYEIELKPAVWQALSRHVSSCLRNFFGLPLLAEIRRTPPQHWLVEYASKAFEFDGTPVWVAPDFGFWDGNRLVLVDWKTGTGGPTAAFQLGCYALYASEVLNRPTDQVKLLEANLRGGRVTRLRWSDDQLAAVRDQIRLSIRSMKAYLVDPVANLARVEDFERTEELRLCRWCNFQAVCRPELSGQTYRGQFSTV
jgi:PD-(D/E)XK nuclease superfamily